MLGIDLEGEHLGRCRVGVGVLVRTDRGIPHHPVVVDGHEEPLGGQGRVEDAARPVHREVAGVERGEDLGGQQVGHAGAPGPHIDGRDVVDIGRARKPDTGGGHARHCSRVRTSAVDRVTSVTTDEQVTFRSDVTVELVRSSASDADVIFAARVSTAGEQSLEDVDADPERSSGLINYLMRDRHGSPFEHNSMTFFVRAPIFVWREHMRHRIASYNEESGRYRQLEPVFYVPAHDRPVVQVGKTGAYEFLPGSDEQYALIDHDMHEACTASYSAYLRMLDAGIAREVARMVLPVSIYSSAYVTVNARSLMNFLSLRRKVEGSHFPSYPQREIEMVAEKYEEVWSALMPITHAAFVKNGRVAP